METVYLLAKQAFEEEGNEIETDLVQAREIGPAIVDEAVELGEPNPGTLWLDA